YTAASDRSVAGDVADADDDELGRLHRCEADGKALDSLVDVALGRGLGVALHEVGVSWRGTLEGSPPEEVVHEGADGEPDLSPERLAVGLEDHPPGAPVAALLQEEGHPPHGDVLPLGRQPVGPLQGAAPPDDVPDRLLDGAKS